LSCIMFKPALPERLLFFTSVKRCLPDPFIAQGQVVIIRPGTR
jgi:hypothetical protein